MTNTQILERDGEWEGRPNLKREVCYARWTLFTATHFSPRSTLPRCVPTDYATLDVGSSSLGYWGSEGGGGSADGMWNWRWQRNVGCRTRARAVNFYTTLPHLVCGPRFSLFSFLWLFERLFLSFLFSFIFHFLIFVNIFIVDLDARHPRTPPRRGSTISHPPLPRPIRLDQRLLWKQAEACAPSIDHLVINSSSAFGVAGRRPHPTSPLALQSRS